MKTNAMKSKQTEQLGERVTKAIVASAKAKSSEHPRLAWALKRRDILDARLGKSVGAERERLRLANIIGSK